MLFLYRYYSNLDYVLDLINNKKLYFSSPNEFNDPFDCRPKFSLLRCRNESIEDWKYFFTILAKEQYPNISAEKALIYAEAAITKGKHMDKKWLLESEEYDCQVTNEELEKKRICCFTKSARNQMMWAHYANNHTGIALQFRSSFMYDGDSGDFKGFNVDYYPKRIKLNRYVSAMKETLEGDDLAFSRFMYCLKSIEWEHEQEIRFFSNNIYVPFPNQMLSGILLGSKCTDQWEAKIREALSSWSVLPKIYKENPEKSSVKIYFNLMS